MRDRTFDGFVTDTGKLTLDFPEVFKAYVKRTFPGCEVTVTVEDRAIAKTRQQEKGFHAMLKPWCAEGHDIDVLKYALKKQIFGEKESVDPITGAVTMVLNKPHTSTLTKAEYSELIERTLEIAAGCGVWLEAPSEYKDRKRQERLAAEKREKKARAA